MATTNGGQNADNAGNARHAENGRHEGRYGDSRDDSKDAHWPFGDNSPSAADYFSDQKDSTIKIGDT